MSAYFRRERDELSWNLEEALEKGGLMLDLEESIDSDLRSDAFNQQNRIIKSHYFSGFFIFIFIFQNGSFRVGNL